MNTVRDSVIQFMREKGLTVMFGNPGSTELPLYRDWPEDFRYILGLQESAVVSMADGYAQASGNAAIVNLHSSAGLGHAMGSLVTAFKNQTPMVVTAGQQARSLLMAEPFLGAVDAAQMPKPWVKWSCEPASAADVPKALARAYAIAMSAPRGPVFVSLPVDDWESPAEPAPALRVHGAPAPDAAALQHAAKEISAAQNPVIVAGPEIDRAGAWDAIIAFAEKLACPVWTSPMSSRCSFPESHAQFAGFLRADHAKVTEALAPYDLVIVIGAPAFTYHFENRSPHPFQPELLQFTNDANTASYTEHGTAIIGDVKAALDELNRTIAARAKFKGAAREKPEPAATDNLTTAAAIDILQVLRPADAIIAEEAPSARPIEQQRLFIERPESFFATASGGLGFAASAAAGLALARPDKLTIALLGDGSALYTIQALWTAAKEQLPVVYVILNNGGYEALKGIARLWQTPSVGTEISGMDFVSLANGFGMNAGRAETADQLRDVLKKAFAERKPFLVDVALAE